MGIAIQLFLLGNIAHNNGAGFGRRLFLRRCGIDSSTIAVDDARDLHRLAADKGFAQLDAPVSGGVKGAVAGTLAFMVGGEPGAFRCVWLTNGFGFYNQATGDLATEASRWALTFDPSGGIVWSTYFNYLQNLALAVDPVARVFGGGVGSYQAISNDPQVWIASVQNITQTTVNRVFHMYAEEQRTVCAKYAVGGPKHHPEFSVVFVDMRDAMSPDPAQSTYPIRYRSAPKSRFVEGIHLNATGWREYFDVAMERWFPRSAFQDLRETSWKA